MIPARKSPLKGSRVRPAAAAWLGPAPPFEHIRVTVHLRGPVPELNRFTDELQSQPPEERKHLSREEFQERFGADRRDIADVEAFAANNRLAVLDIHPGKRTVELGGTVAAFSRAFGVRLHLFRGPRGVFRAPIGRVWVPTSIRPAVVAVLGFDTRPIAQPHFRRLRKVPIRLPRRAAAVPQTYSPPQVAELYQYPQGTDGTGQCIGIIELGGGFTQAELDQYFQGLGISPAPTVSAVPVHGGSNTPTGNPDGPDAEVMLDLEVTGSIAPKANIVAYFGPNTDQGFAATVLAAIFDTTNKPSILSISWGGPEQRWPAQAVRAMNQAIQSGLAMGVTVFVAAGDSGSSDGIQRGLAVDFPASSPYAVGCGGTMLIGSGKTITSETVWNDIGDGATGGGVSILFPVPSFQSGINPISASPARGPGRGVPDVSGNASPRTGYDILVDGQSAPIGGTSAVAPLWSALLARIQQQLGHSAAPLLPAIYASPSSFRDITIGNNGAYRAGPGWDACSGLGSPIGTALSSALAGQQARAPSASSRREGRVLAGQPRVHQASSKTGGGRSTVQATTPKPRSSK